MADTTTLKDKIRSTIYPNGRGAINASKHQSMLLEMADVLIEANNNIEVLQTEQESNSVAIEDLQENKVDHGSYAPDLSVGVADHLAGHDEPTPSEFTFRKSGGGAILSGNARVQSVKGNSVVWNNLVEGIVEGSQYGYKVSMVDRKVLIQNVSATTPDFGNLAKIRGFKPIAGHKYVLLTDNQDIDIAFNSLNGFESKANVIVTAPDITYNDIYLRTNSAPSLTILPKGGSLTLRYVICDLTQMFRAGNEPQTIDDFYSRIPQGIDMDAYNEGEVIHMNVDAVKSVGFNQWDEIWEQGQISQADGSNVASDYHIRSKNFIKVMPGKTYVMVGTFRVIFYDAEKEFVDWWSVGTIREFTLPDNVFYVRLYTEGATYNHDICINISDAEKDGIYEPYISRMQSLEILRKYFPNGMRSAGTAHDEIRYNKATQKWEAVKRIGEVDLGELTYDKSGVAANAFYTTDLQLIVRHESKNILSAKFVSGNDAANNGVMSNDINGTMYFNLAPYTDAASFKAAMQGVILYYELANPIVTEIEEAFNLDYEVWDGGTEQAIADTPTSAFKADIIYGFNAYGVIKELKEQIATLQAAIAKMNV